VQSSILFIQGGWEGHKPHRIVATFEGPLKASGWQTQVVTSLDILSDAAALAKFSVIFPCWTMGQLPTAAQRALCGAVGSGTGLAGVHGGMGDAFRGSIDYEWMVGGLFVGHPHVGDYQVTVTRPEHPLMQGMPPVFAYNSEQYYMLVDPAVEVLAETIYLHEGKSCRMPVVWTKSWGKGRVFYCSLGHAPEEFERHPYVRDLVLRGIHWTAKPA
jgi:type 1 glutamine amidotransferase